MTEMIISSVIFIVALFLIFTEKMNRSITGIAGAALMVGFGTAMGFYSQDKATKTIIPKSNPRVLKSMAGTASSCE